MDLKPGDRVSFLAGAGVSFATEVLAVDEENNLVQIAGEGWPAWERPGWTHRSWVDPIVTAPSPVTR